MAVVGDILVVAKSYCWEGRQEGQKGEKIGISVYNMKEFKM